MTVTLEGLLVCRDEREAAIVRAALPMHIELTRAEPGCELFEVEPTDDPLVWSVRERFSSAAEFTAHQARVAASAWGAETDGIERRYTVTGL